MVQNEDHKNRFVCEAGERLNPVGHDPYKIEEQIAAYRKPYPAGFGSMSDHHGGQHDNEDESGPESCFPRNRLR